MSTIQEKVRSDIKKYGHHIIHVMEEDGDPNFSYTIGLFETYQKPEIIIIGQSQEMLQVLLNNLAYDYKEGRTLISGNLEEDILDDYKCMALDVAKEFYEEYLGIAMDYYKGMDFPAMQIIWPTTSNQYPYDKDAPEGFKKWQPVLGNLPKKTK